MRKDFADDSATAVPVVIPDAVGLDPADLARYAADLSRVPDVSGVTAPSGTYVAGNRIGPPADHPIESERAICPAHGPRDGAGKHINGGGHRARWPRDVQGVHRRCDCQSASMRSRSSTLR